MTDPRTILARIRARADAATEGPWEWEGESDEAWPQGENSLIARGDAEDLVIGSWGHDAYGITVDDPDAEFIAASRTTVPALLDALEKVLELHHPIPCTITDRHGVSDSTVCDHCLNPEWPCPTVAAVTAALAGVEGEG